MARLNNLCLLQHGEDEPESESAADSDGSDESDIDRSSNPPMPKLTTRVLSKGDLEQVNGSTDLNQFLGTSDLQRALDLGRQIIVARSQVAETVNLQCAWDISVVWRMIGKLEVDRPRAKAVITKWRNEIGRQLRNDSKDIDYYLGLADKTLSQLTEYTKRIYDLWGVLPTQVFPKDKYCAARPPSKGVIQAMAQLAEHVSREEGQDLLLKEINRRCNEKTRVKYDRREPHLLPIDIKAALRSKKRPLDDQASDAEPAVARAERKPDKRQRLGSVVNPAMDNADRGDGDASPNGGQSSPSNRSEQQFTLFSASNLGEPAKKDDEAAEGNKETAEKDNEAAEENEENAEIDDEAAKGNEETAEEDTETPQPSRSRRHSNDTVGLPDGSNDLSIEMARGNAISLPDFESPGLPITDDSTLHLRSLKRSVWVSPSASPSRRPNTLYSPSPLLVAAAADTPMVLDDDSSNIDSASFAIDGEIDTSSLSFNKKLSSTVIQQSLTYCLPADCHIIDPLYFDSAFPDRCSLKRQLDESVRRIFIPLHDPQHVHWRLAVLKLDKFSLTIYDSLFSGEIDRALTERVQNFAEGVASGQAWTTQWERCPQQSNGVDCGIHVIANAFFLMADKALPDSHDCDVWRLICKSLIDNDSTKQVPVEELLQFHCRISTNVAQAIMPAPPANDNADISGINLRQLNQHAQQYLSNVQAQERKLKNTLGSAAAIFEVFDELRRRQSLKVFSLGEQHAKDEENLKEHDALIEQYNRFTDQVSSNDTMTQSVFSALRAIQVKNGKAEKELERLGQGLERRPLRIWRDAFASQLAKMRDRRKTLQAGLVRFKTAVQVARQITDSCEEKLHTVVEAKTKLRHLTQGWRDFLANTLQGLDVTLTCISKPDVDQY
ncbi:MAG: hypothetical protein OHK93_003322 [Ramalina farinacea]|uniref:Ubiquitin-like protease family profile domain-containing protein n=1 Tax=Ramalina farinacea TaxID=258253 RepID=A0AA43QXJ0_9LECA|nr:hypothetical protein [Ramalina farinacea]